VQFPHILHDHGQTHRQCDSLKLLTNETSQICSVQSASVAADRL